jgi:hypothetical protein
VSLKVALAGGLAAVSIAAAVSSTVIPALACSCAGAPSPNSPSASNPVTFLGRVKSIAPATVGSHLDRVEFTTLEGDQFGVGARGVLTPASEAACGYAFVVGSTYLVRAHVNADGAEVTDACSGTQLSNRPLPNVGYPSDPVPHQGWVIPVLVGLAIIATLTASGLLVARRLLRR